MILEKHWFLERVAVFTASCFFGLVENNKSLVIKYK